MTLEPIYNQKVLSPKYTRNYLPPIEADSSQIKQLIEQKYSKTIVLPISKTTEVNNYTENQKINEVQESNNYQPQEIIAQRQTNIQQNIISSGPVLSQSQNYKYNLYQNNINNRPIKAQLITPNNKSAIYRRPFAAYNPSKVNPTI